VVPGNGQVAQYYMAMSAFNLYLTPLACFIGALILLPRAPLQEVDWKTSGFLLFFGFWSFPRYLYPLVEWLFSRTTLTPVSRTAHMIFCNTLHQLAPNDSRFWMVSPLVPIYWTVCLWFVCHSAPLQLLGGGFLMNVLWANLTHALHRFNHLDNDSLRVLHYAKHLHPSYFRECLFNPSSTTTAEQKENKQE